MKKIFTLWTLLLIVAFGSVADRTISRPSIYPTDGYSKSVQTPVDHRMKLDGIEEEQEPLPTPNLGDDEVMIYAYRMAANAGYMHGWYRFPSSAPWNMEVVKNFGSEAADYGISAATYVKGETYVYVMQHYGTDSSGWNDYQMPIGFGKMNYETGEYEVLYDTSKDFHYFEYGDLVWDMAYDPVTDTIYAYTWAISSAGEFLDLTDIYTIDPKTCKPTFVGQLDCSILAMAANNGRVYGLRQDYDEDAGKAVTSIVSFDPTNVVDGVFQSEHVVDIFNGHMVNYTIQTLEFDLTTHKLWWMGFKNHIPIIAEINLETGRVSNESEIPYSAQHRGMIIPCQIAADDAPAQVTEMKVVAAANGVGEATITWKNPTTTYQLEALTELTGVKVYRNEELITTIETSAVGEEMTYTDTNVPSGNQVYKLVPYNAAGDGLYREYRLFVGQDVPAGVIDLQANVFKDEVTLTWKKPETGVNGGWYDESTLKYTVWRGSTKVATNITETTLKDKVTFYAAHEYTIESMTDAGEGASASIKVTFGPAVELPYENTFDTEEKAGEVIVVDANNDGISWYYSEGYEGYAYITSSNKADDYMVLPPVNLESGKKYQVRFYYYTSNWYGTEEKVQLVVGPGKSADKLTTVVDEFTFEGGSKGANWYETHTEYMSDATGEFNFAFKCVSEPDMGFVILSHIQIREMSEIEAAAEDINGAIDGYVDTPAEYTVTVKNYGTLEIPSAIVKLIDFDGENQTTIAETTIEALAVGETRDVKISWTPTEARNYRIFGSIRAEGDPFSWDNVTDKHLNVAVNSADGDRWLTIGTENLDKYDNRLIDVQRKCSRSQWFFYPDEIGDDMEITGIRLHYAASEDAEYLTNVPLVIRMMNTTEEAFLDPGYGYGGGFIDASEFTEVFNGTVDINGTSPEMNILEVKFEKPFSYSATSNLLIDLEKNWNDVFGMVYWYFDMNPNHPYRQSEYKDSWGEYLYYGRGGFYNWTVPHSEDPWNTVTDHFPYIKLGYRIPGSVSAIGSASDLVITNTENALVFSKKCDMVNVYSISGGIVLGANNVAALSTESLTAGIYIVKAIENGNVTTKKVVIK